MLPARTVMQRDPRLTVKYPANPERVLCYSFFFCDKSGEGTGRGESIHWVEQAFMPAARLQIKLQIKDRGL